MSVTQACCELPSSASLITLVSVCNNSIAQNEIYIATEQFTFC